MRFEDTAVIVTGAAGGIGSATCRAFAREGARLLLFDLEATEPLAADLGLPGEAVLCIQGDASRQEDVRRAVATTHETFGAIDVLVNVAGIVAFGPAATLDEGEWDRVLAANLKSSFLFSQSVIEPMRARRSGRIINIGSVVGKNGGNPRP